MAVKALLIDYGGVLYYEASKSILYSAVANYLESLGVRAGVSEVSKALSNWSLEGPVEQGIGYAAALLLKRLGITPKTSRVKGLESVMKAAIVSLSRPLPWAARLLDEARSSGLRIALISNHWCHECVVTTLERDGLNNYFDAVVTSDLVGYCKPDPHIFEAVLKLLGVKACESAFIDDNELNIKGAFKAGITRTHKFIKCDEGVEEALRFIKGLRE